MNKLVFVFFNILWFTLIYFYINLLIYKKSIIYIFKMNTSETNPEIIEARKKMAEKFGNLKLGGKGKLKFNRD